MARPEANTRRRITESLRKGERPGPGPPEPHGGRWIKIDRSGSVGVAIRGALRQSSDLAPRDPDTSPAQLYGNVGLGPLHIGMVECKCLTG